MKGAKTVIFIATIICGFMDAHIFADVINNDDMLYIPSGQSYTLEGIHSYNSSVNIEGTLYVKAYDGGDSAGTLELYAPEIKVSGIIDANSRGFRENSGPGAGDNCSGGGYGNIGGNSGYSGLFGGVAYGTKWYPDVSRGSGGGHGAQLYGGTLPAGAGGGCIVLDGNSVTISGTVAANGGEGVGGSISYCGAGGGSGGCILISAEYVFVYGMLTACGGSGGDGSFGGGGGAGGRIKIFNDYLDTTGSTILYKGGSGGEGSPDGEPGGLGSFYAECERPAPWRGGGGTYAKWLFDSNEINPKANEMVNPYGEPNLVVIPFPDKGWFSGQYSRQGVWALFDSINVQIPNRSGSGPASMKLIWIQVDWIRKAGTPPDESPDIIESGSALPRYAAKYSDIVLEEVSEDGETRNWKHSAYVLILTPNPDSEVITITGSFSIDSLTIETICVAGMKMADLNGDSGVDMIDLAILSNHWLNGVVQ